MGMGGWGGVSPMSTNVQLRQFESKRWSGVVVRVKCVSRDNGSVRETGEQTKV